VTGVPNRSRPQRPFLVNAGTSATALSATEYLCKAVLIMNDDGVGANSNSERMIVGDSGIVNTDPGFLPGQGIVYEAAPGTLLDLATIFVTKPVAEPVTVYAMG